MALANGRTDFNTARPHSQLVWQTPKAFASTFTPRRALAPRSCKLRVGARPPARMGSVTARNELSAG
jgi:putative transposase